jgi:ABC-2 type transport system permease protein
MLAGRRDLGAGVLQDATAAKPSRRLLGSTTAQALRSVRGGLLGWSLGLGAAGLMFGLIAHSVAQIAATSSGLRRTAGRWGAVNIATAEGYLGLAFLFISVALCVYGANQIGSTREEESSGRLDLLLSAPVGRARWLSGRLLVACGCVAAATLAAVLLGWIGAEAQGSNVPLGRMLQAALDSFAVAALFIGLGALLFAAVPRLASSLTLGLVAGAFLLELVGAAVKAPAWLLWLSPFHHLSLAPAATLDIPTTLAFLAIALMAALAGVRLFVGRDVMGA